mgnify:CR=1 FL=1
MLALWVRGVLARRFMRVAGTAAGVALTVALLATLTLFLLGAGASMTARAISAVSIDWQVQLIPGADPDAVAKVLEATADVRATHRVRYADIAGLEARTGDTTQTTGPGQAIAFDDGYSKDFPAEIRSLSGSVDGALVAQQTAANLHVGPGDMIAIRRSGGLPPASVRIAGVVDLPDADSLFQLPGLPPRAAPQAPPDNVLVLPAEDWRKLFGSPDTPHPESTRLQLHVRLAHGSLPADPTAAYAFATGKKRNLEIGLAGQAVVADNLGARLDAVRQDALYVSVLFLFLGVPGIALAIALTMAVTMSTAGGRRIEQALLRVRGAPMRRILILSAAEAMVASIGGITLGLACALYFLGFVPGLRDNSASAGTTLLLVAIAGLLVGLAAYLLPAWRDARLIATGQARRAVIRTTTPLWQRLWLDLALLAEAGFFFWQQASTGYQIVLAPEGVAATSVDYKAFIAPALFWTGMALLTIRLSGRIIVRNGRPLRALIAPVCGPLAAIVAAALSRQASRLTLGIAMTALAISFATSTAIFNETYNAQARVDAELTNGSDVTVFGTTDRPAGAQLAALEQLPETAAAEPMQHRFAYVGADLQDLYGIDPRRIGQATTLSDAYFDGTAADVLGRLASTPDGVLVSEETVQDFQLQPGDTINLRLINARDHQYHPVAFRFVGIAREFPTAPRDSFLVANAAYVGRMTGSDAAEYVLMRSRGDPTALARQASTELSFDPSLKVADIGEATRLIGSSLTAVNLRGLTTVELSFSAVMAAASAGLMLALGFVERRRTFSILGAIGARPGQLAAFLWAEGVLVVAGGILFGLASGITTAWMLVKLLTGVFDPPPQALSVPWLYLGTMLGLLIASVAAAVLFTRPRPGHDAERLRDF